MAKLFLSIYKYAAYQSGIQAAYANLIPLGGQESQRIQTMIPIGGDNPKGVEVTAGEWLVSARLPSGESLTKTVIVKDSEPTHLSLQAIPSPSETKSWTSTFSADAAALDQHSFRKTLRGEVLGEFLLDYPGSFLRLESTTPHLEQVSSFIEREPLEVLFDDEGAFQTLSVDDWPGNAEGGGNIIFEPGRFRIHSQQRVYVALPKFRMVIAIPLTWPEALIQVRTVPDLRGAPGDLRLRAWILDHDAAPIMSYLEGQDLEAARFLAEPTAVWAEQALAEKGKNPLAAAAGALALLRLGEHQRLRDWPLNLAERFPSLPDGAAIAAWCTIMLGMRHAGSPNDFSFGERAAQGLRFVKQALQTGPPYFADSVRLLRHVCQVLRHSKSSSRLRKREWARAEKLFQAVRPDSFIATYTRQPREQWRTLLGNTREA